MKPVKRLILEGFWRARFAFLADFLLIKFPLREALYFYIYKWGRMFFNLYLLIFTKLILSIAHFIVIKLSTSNRS